MIVVPVNELPEQRKRSSCIRNGEYLREFLAMNVRYAYFNVEPFEYSHIYSAYTSLKNIVRFYDMPIEVRLINAEIYLINLLLGGYEP